MRFVELDINNAEEVYALSQRVIVSLVNKDHLRNNSLEQFKAALGGSSVAYGCYVGDVLIGCAMAIVEGQDTFVELHHMIEGKAGYFKLVMVDEQFRGLGLQRKFITMIEERVQALGVDYLWLTVAPDNVYSKRNFMDMGYKVDHQEVKYGGLIRDILVKLL